MFIESKTDESFQRTNKNHLMHRAERNKENKIHAKTTAPLDFQQGRH